MLTDVLDVLACPVCHSTLQEADRTLRCAEGHSFDIARQGYVNLLPGNARTGTADTPEMIQARDTFLGAGHLAGLAESLARSVAPTLPREACVLDAGAGTGYYLARVLQDTQDAVGLAIDISKHALRKAARAHPRIGAVVADVWQPLPVRSGTVTAVLNVFAPRNAAEFHRVLRPDGALHVVTPTARHLGRLIPELGLLKVDERKQERTDRTLRDHFHPGSTEEYETEAHLTHDEVITLVRMGPSAHHLTTEDLQTRLRELPDPVPVPLSVAISAYLPHRSDGRPEPQ